MNYYETEKETRPKAGDVVRIEVKNEYDLMIQNDLGGSTFLPKGSYAVEIQKVFFDYETGWRAIGTLMDESARAIAASIGATEYSPKIADWDAYRCYFFLEREARP